MAEIDREIMGQLMRGNRTLMKAFADRVYDHTTSEGADPSDTASFDPHEVMRSAMRKGMNYLPLEQRILMQLGIEEREAQQARRFVLLLFDSYGSLNRTAIKELCRDMPNIDDEVIAGLERDGLIEREGLATLAQNGTFRLSEAGEDAVQEMVMRQDAAAADLLSPLDEDEKAELARLLRKLAAGLKERMPADAPSIRAGRAAADALSER